MAQRWSLDELNGAEVDGFDCFAGLEISTVRSKLRKDGGVGEQGFAGGESSRIGTKSFQFGSIAGRNDMEWGGL